MKLIYRACSPAFVVTAALLVIGICILDPNTESFGDEVFVILFVLWPLVLSLFLALITQSRSSQITLIIGSILYGACFSFIYGSSGAQSGVALLFMGFYSLPVMVPIWGVAVFLRRKPQLEKADPESTNLAPLSSIPESGKGRGE